LQQQVAKEHGFEISTHRLELYGRCSRCAGH
jgi:Fe2+ or Zn2+ uptake regulation protein